MTWQVCDVARVFGRVRDANSVVTKTMVPTNSRPGHLGEAVTPADVHAQPADGLRVDAAPYTPSNGLPVQSHVTHLTCNALSGDMGVEF